MNVIAPEDEMVRGFEAAPVSVSQRSLRTVKRLASGIASLFLLSSAQAVLTTVTYTPNPVDLNDLDHHSLYTWRIDNVPNVTILSASLNFDNITNWDTNANVLHMHLLDTAINPGVASFIDDLTGATPVTDLTDDFTNARFHNNQLNLRGPWLVADGTGSLSLGDPSFTTTATDYSVAFSQSRLDTLNAFRQNGNDIAFGFDPDCHYWNDGVSVTISFDLPAGPASSPIPEVSAFLPLSAILGLAILTQSRTRRRGRVLVGAECLS